jgi:hypothetical protein
MHGESCPDPWRIVQTLAQAIAARVGRAAGRLPHVAHYAREIGLCLGWDEPRLRALRVASILHDAGELASPGISAGCPSQTSPLERSCFGRSSGAGECGWSRRSCGDGSLAPRMLGR